MFFALAYFPIQEHHCLNILFKESYGLRTMASDPLEKLDEKWKDFDFSNVIALLMLMKEIQEQEPLDDPDIIMIAKDGTPLY